MKKSLVAVVLVLVIGFGSNSYSTSVQTSPNLDCVDTPTCNTLLRGMYNLHLRFYEGGGVLTRAWVGFGNSLMIGASFNLDNVIGQGNVTGREPKILAKIKIIDDSPAFPSLAIGYEPQAYGYYMPGIDRYTVKPIGLYAVITKQVIPNLFITVGAGNHNVFKDFKADTDLGIFANSIIQLSQDFSFLFEYNDILNKDAGCLSAGLRYAFAPELRIEFDLKGLTNSSENYIRNLRIDYINYF
jgi:hypothetical protein